VLGLRVDAPNMAALRYGALLPSLPPDGPPVAFYTRNRLGGPARVDHMKPGTYTVCAVSPPMKCTPVAIGGGEKKLTIMVPA